MVQEEKLQEGFVGLRSAATFDIAGCRSARMAVVEISVAPVWVKFVRPVIIVADDCRWMSLHRLEARNSRV